MGGMLREGISPLLNMHAMEREREREREEKGKIAMVHVKNKKKFLSHGTQFPSYSTTSAEEGTFLFSSRGKEKINARNGSTSSQRKREGERKQGG